MFENFTDVSSYSYDPVKMELVSYDTPDIISLKAQYINSKGLGGAMFWEVSVVMSLLPLLYLLRVPTSFRLTKLAQNLWLERQPVYWALLTRRPTTSSTSGPER